MTARRTWCVALSGLMGLSLAGSLAACHNPAAPAQTGQTAPEAAAWRAFLEGEGSAPFVDFSSAGAHYSERAPSPRVEIVFPVSDYGAQADDEIDDTRSIQAAIKAAEATGGGIIQFAAGTYRINEEPAFEGLRISRSNIVLRGSDEGRTRLVMTRPMPPANPRQKWSGPAMIRFQPEDTDEPDSRSWPDDGRHDVLSSRHRGDRTLAVRDASGFHAGDYITLSLRSPQARDAFLQGRQTRPIWERLNSEGVMVREHHEIERVEGDTLYLRRPLLVDINADWPWQVRPLKVITHVGFENICFEGSFTETFEHHRDALHDSGFRAIELTRTAHSWVRGNCFENVSSAVTLRGGLANSVLLNQISGNGGHFSFHTEFGTRNLIGLNIDNSVGGQFHGPGASHMSAGSVIWRFVGPQSRGFDLHATFPRHSLFDLVETAGFSASGGNYKEHPNHGPGLVLWNYNQTGKTAETPAISLDFWDLPDDDSRLYWSATAINPVMVGYRGPITEVAEAHMGWLESLGAAVTPASLFEAQLEQRLGHRPLWLDDALKAWNRLLTEAG